MWQVLLQLLAHAFEKIEVRNSANRVITDEQKYGIENLMHKSL
jgi:hypothetical protein